MCHQACPWQCTSKRCNWGWDSLSDSESWLSLGAGFGLQDGKRSAMAFWPRGGGVVGGRVCVCVKQSGRVGLGTRRAAWAPSLDGAAVSWRQSRQNRVCRVCVVVGVPRGLPRAIVLVETSKTVGDCSTGSSVSNPFF